MALQRHTPCGSLAFARKPTANPQGATRSRYYSKPSLVYLNKHEALYCHAGLAYQILVFQARHFDVDVNAIQQRAGDSLLILCHSRWSTGARLDRIAVIAAWAGIYIIGHICHIRSTTGE